MPIDHVIAIYARENGQGMAFPMPTDGQKPAAGDAADAAAPASGMRGPRLTLTGSPNAKAENTGAGDDDSIPPEPPAGGRPSLKRVK